MNSSFKVFLIILFSLALGIFFRMQNDRSLLSRVDVDYINELNSNSKPIKGLIGWEKDQEFQKICYQHQTIWRLAAFQTTFPDILFDEQYNVAFAAKMLRGKVIYPGEIFSMNRSVGPYTEARGFKKGRSYQGNRVVKTPGGGVCKVASALYNLAILANLPIIARKNHGMLVSYVSPGRDAAVSDCGLDFRFKNNTTDPIVIWSKSVDNTLYMAFYGGTRPPEVIWHQEIVKMQDFPTIYRYNSQLKNGAEKVIIPGAPGVTVKSWLTINYGTGQTKEKNLGQDYYKPMTRVIEHGPK